MNTIMVKPRFCQTWAMIVSGMAQLPEPKKAEWMPTWPRMAWAGLDRGSKISSQTMPTTVTPRTMGRKTRMRSSDAVRPVPCSRCASASAMAFWITVTPITKYSESPRLATKPATGWSTASCSCPGP